jgi:hypothetical protein
MQENLEFSARTIDWVTPAWQSQYYKPLSNWLLRFRPPEGAGLGLTEHSLLLSPAMWLLALVACLLYWRKHDKVKWLGLVVLCGMLLSLGPYFIDNQNRLNAIPLPYLWLYRFLPVFQALRVPARMFYMVLPALTFLGALGFDAIFSRSKLRWFAFGVLVIILGTEAKLAGNFADRPAQAVVAERVAKSAFGAKLAGSHTLHLPVYAPKTRLTVALSWLPYTNELSFNGYSGYFPPDWLKLADSFTRKLDGTNLAVLKALDFDYVILHRRELKQQQLLMEKQTLKRFGFKKVYEDDDVYIYDLKTGQTDTKICQTHQAPLIEFRGLSISQKPVWKLNNTDACLWVNPNPGVFKTGFVYYSGLENSAKFSVSFKLPLYVSPRSNSYIPGSTVVPLSKQQQNDLYMGVANLQFSF